MVLFHNALDDLQQRLNDAEREKSKWQLVDDLLVENLAAEVDHCKVSISGWSDHTHTHCECHWLLD